MDFEIIPQDCSLGDPLPKLPAEALNSNIFSSPEHKVLKVSYCEHPVSGVRRQSSVVRRVSSTIHSKHISS